METNRAKCPKCSIALKIYEDFVFLCLLTGGGLAARAGGSTLVVVSVQKCQHGGDEQGCIVIHLPEEQRHGGAGIPTAPGK